MTEFETDYYYHQQLMPTDHTHNQPTTTAMFVTTNEMNYTKVPANQSHYEDETVRRLNLFKNF